MGKLQYSRSIKKNHNIFTGTAFCGKHHLCAIKSVIFSKGRNDLVWRERTWVVGILGIQPVLFVKVSNVSMGFSFYNVVSSYDGAPAKSKCQRTMRSTHMRGDASQVA